jgi:hypothetical protein
MLCELHEDSFHWSGVEKWEPLPNWSPEEMEAAGWGSPAREAGWGSPAREASPEVEEVRSAEVRVAPAATMFGTVGKLIVTGASAAEMVERMMGRGVLSPLLFEGSDSDELPDLESSDDEWVGEGSLYDPLRIADDELSWELRE